MIKCNYCGSEARYWTKHGDTIVCVCEKCKDGKCRGSARFVLAVLGVLLCLIVCI